MARAALPYDDFLEWCQTKAGDLGRRAWEIGTNEDETNRTGHVMRGYLASVQFLRQYPSVAKWLNRTEGTVTNPVDIHATQFEKRWKQFLDKPKNRVEHAILHKILPTSLGGKTEGGGGGAYPFKLALRLAAIALAENAGPFDESKVSPKYRMVRKREFDRDYETLNTLKKLYEYRCQVCGRSIHLGGDRYCCEGHHIRPLGSDHGGRDEQSNVLILCPTHHAEFDFFLFAIINLKKNKGQLEHMYRNLGSDEATITLKHKISSDSVDYVIEQFLTRLDLYFSKKK